jgi:hypothetical protein
MLDSHCFYNVFCRGDQQQTPKSLHLLFQGSDEDSTYCTVAKVSKSGESADHRVPTLPPPSTRSECR